MAKEITIYIFSLVSDTETSQSWLGMYIMSQMVGHISFCVLHGGWELVGDNMQKLEKKNTLNFEIGKKKLFQENVMFS